MGGLWKRLPVAFWTFLIAGCSLAGLPLITAGAFSKDWILWGAASAAQGSTRLWVAALVGVLFTSLYTFRMIFLVFFGESHTPVTKKPGAAMLIPCIVLAFLSIAGGYIRIPFAHFLEEVLPWTTRAAAAVPISESASATAAGLVFLLGLLLAWFFILRRPSLTKSLATNPAGAALHRFWFSDWAMDWLYDRIFVRPVLWIAQIGKGDVIDGSYDGLALLTQGGWRALCSTQSGKLRWYAAAIAGGTIIFIAVVLFL
jgi:NADH-quinone oxidoreductase subunit L